MVAKEIQEPGKDKEENDEEDGGDDYEKDDPDEDTNKQTKMGQVGDRKTTLN